MMRPRVMVAVTLITVMLACITASVSSAQERPEGASRDTTRTSPRQPEPTGKVSDLRVDHIWLDDQCRINVKLKNTGEHAIPDREHNQGMVRVYVGRSHEDFYLRKTSAQKKPAVDPKGALKIPGSTLSYNTGIELKEKLTVEACVGLNRITATDRRKGISIVMRPMCGQGPDLTQKPKEINIKPTLLLCGGKIPTIKGDDGDNVINGTPGDDVIHGGGGNDTIDGKGGNDIICGGYGNDTILGGDSSTIVIDYYFSCSDPWTGDHDRLYGGPGNDTLDGGPGTDCVLGEAGDDKLYGVEDEDVLDGGPGNDTYYFVNETGTAKVKVIEAPNANTDTLDFSQFPTQNGIHVYLYEVNGQNVGSGPLTVYLSSDTGIENLIGTPHQDALRGNSRDNYIIGGDSPTSYPQYELLEGREGNDTLMGGDGSHRLYGEFETDPSSGPPGDDILDGGAGMDNLFGGPGNDQIIGGQGDDYLYGHSGNDQLTGGQGDDFMEGGPGDDLYLFVGSNLGEDTVHEEPNVDTDTLDYSQFTSGGISAAPGNINLVGGSKILELNYGTGIENIIGTDFDDYIHGNSRDNVFEGKAGNDQLYGEQGNDTLNGGNDNDELRGGPGDDQLAGDSGDDMLWGEGPQTQVYAVTWTAGVNVDIQTGLQILTKNSGGNAWNAGAASVETLAAGDGFVQTTVAETNTNRMIGLSNGNSGVDYTDIDFAVNLMDNGILRVSENGSFVFVGPSYQSGDEITVEVSGGTVYYKQNGTTFYTSSNTPNYPLLVDTSVFNLNATLKWVSIGGGFIQGTDTCDGGTGQDTAGPSCETKISIEVNNPNM